jgi:transcriptional regulator with XRE-family HTH domain
MYIGSRIKELRKQRHIKLYELAEKCGVQIATLSRMEHNKMTGTLDSHLKIADALGIELSELYSNLNKGDSIEEPELNASSSPEVFIYNEAARHEILTNNVNRKKMIPLLLRIDPGGQTSPETNAFGTEKFIYTIEGELETMISNKPFLLAKNHGLYFDGSKNHYYRNISSQPCTALVIATQSTS